ncbi:CbtB domain-containing protein [Acidipropionibacterium jensenii]|uniref:CbtB-domain containing protein n=1 Tax=Acidipropionibacterium jensenii TaxID=1749 RepID=A0A3S4W8Q3_9ACTN|nr:CbtB domain-containing protein [Acidipropionibacterium jensenii]MDN5995517.1 CbtB-domain containing protein [Acidipropionibacterium jensenii]MDN6426687.1 CbtB-domain containing protein [Acidipropionibacterium jensenii]MDN6481571.1 CbtB-domain containing protein [Acidipropionibacterium jensenii]MDN6762537.1 CbtB-domain containing protein [Acidipropionibacterium jensenii]MDN6792429.1 CbtB-domain containing protein [Acidipropionibacterium jensenii]
MASHEIAVKPQVGAVDWAKDSALGWVIGAVVVALLLYYFIGVDQGAYSVFGNDMHIHEWVHDSRHFLGFPCH